MMSIETLSILFWTILATLAIVGLAKFCYQMGYDDGEWKEIHKSISENYELQKKVYLLEQYLEQQKRKKKK